MEDDAERADLVVAMEAAHVRYVRRHHPAAADRTGTLRRLVATLGPPVEPLDQRVAALGLARVELSDDEDVADPAGQDQAAYVACAVELWALCRSLAERL
jgi:protein-tyrosine-phosphatase